MVQRLLEAWQKQQTQASGPQTAALEPKSTGEDEVLLKARPKTKKPSFLRALVRTFTSSLLMGACFKLIQDLLSFINPQLLSILIRFISDPTAPTWWGFLLAGLMFVSSTMQTLILHQHYHCIFVMALRIRTAIIGVIYRKVSRSGTRTGRGQFWVAREKFLGLVHPPNSSSAGSDHHQLSQT